MISAYDSLIAVMSRPAMEVRQSLDINIPKLPRPVASDGRSVLAFEVHATNFTDAPIDLRSIRIVDDTNGRILGSF